VFSKSLITSFILFFIILIGFVKPAIAQAQPEPARDPVPLDRTAFTIKSLFLPYQGDHLLIRVNNKENNKTLCLDGGEYLQVQRSMPHFNEIVSLATAAMLTGKTVMVGRVGRPLCSEWAHAYIDSLEVMN
jgi:hypothetical protein